MTDAVPPETLQRILIAARGRRLDDAAVLCASAMAAHPADSRLSALGGAIEMQRGQFVRAAELLAPALLQNPADVTVRGNLAEARYHTGDMAGALALCDAAASAADPSGRLLRLGAYFAQESGDYQLAAALYRQIVAQKPDDWSSWNNLGNTLGSLEDYDGAIAAFEQVAAKSPGDRTIALNLANTYAARGDLDEAIARLQKLAEQAPAATTLRTVAEHRVHLDTGVHEHHAAGLADRRFARVEFDLDELHLGALDLVVDNVHAHAPIPLAGDTK